MPRIAMLLRFAGILSTAGIIVACSVADSVYVEPAAMRDAAFWPRNTPPVCKSALGAYSLPKTFLKVTVKQSGGAPVELETVEVRRAESSLTFCLDHLADPMADDEIRVIKSSGQVDPSYGLPDDAFSTDSEKRKAAAKEAATKKIILGQEANTGYGTQLLQWVVSNTVDQSEYIAKTLIRTAFIALSGKPNFTPLNRSLPGRKDGEDKATRTLAILEYDPFDAEKSAAVNQRLRGLDHCLILENFTFNTRRMTVNQYCNSPSVIRSAFDEAYTGYQSGPPPVIKGIAYRPRIDYGLSIYRRTKGNRREWRLYKQQRVTLENISPIVSIGITRSTFAARRAALMFDLGVLKAMCLVKTSELQSAVQVPFEIAKSIIALPTQVFEVKIGNARDNIALVKAEDAVTKAQKDYLDFLADQAQTSADTPSEKQNAVPLESDNSAQLPTRPTITITRSTSANLSELQSDILGQICVGAPDIILPGPRPQTDGARP